jgi:hypothetical protein
MVWGGVSFWRSLMRLDLIDVRLDLYPCVAGEGTRLFNDDAPKSYRLDLVSSTAFSNGIVGCSTAGTASPAARRYARRGGTVDRFN